jgi:hypothetical protein
MTANICEVCGKQFIKSCGHMYKMNYKSKTKSFCSYTCWNKVVKLKENKEFDKLDKIYAKSDTRINI